MAHILVADDEPDLLDLVTVKLHNAGHRVHAVTDGAAALVAVHRRDLDAAILDVRMPGSDGLSVCRRLRADATTAALPVLLLSACATEEQVVAGLVAGATDYLIKPFSPRELLTRLEMMLRAQHRTRHACSTAHAAARQAASTVAMLRQLRYDTTRRV